jgi:poly-gamma-glutamate synthesis protein (capsule biosynthesis protein)
LPLETGAGVLETVQLRSLSTTLAICGALAALGCERSASALLELPAPVAETAPAPPAVVAPPPPSAPPEELTLIAGGDVSFGRGLGQELLRDPQHDPFAPSATLLASADARFVNLESQLSDQRGETQSPFMELVFTGPPAGAGALSRAGITVVSTANNHMWDYGRNAFLETLDHLDRAGVLYAGGGRTPKQAYGPVILDIKGFRVAVLAVTDIWNQGRLADHPGRYHVAIADPALLSEAVRAARAAPGVDAVVVSYHGGGEYIDGPMPRTRVIARAAIDAGADAVLGHHPHVVQGVEIRHGRPIFYSLGNFLMRTYQARPETALGMLARLRLRRGAPPSAELCPIRAEGLTAIPLAADPQREDTEQAFLARLRRTRVHIRDAPDLGSFGPDGCAPVIPREPPARR